jgi:FkbM family methyltransferase
MNPLTILQRVKAEPAPIRLVASRLLWRSRLSGRFVIQRAGYRIRFHPSAVSAEAWRRPRFVSAEEQFVSNVLQPGNTYIDVGANVGLIALRAASIVGPSGRVVAIEAHPRTVEFFADNVRLNGFSQVSVVHAAVGEEAGVLHLSSERSDDQNHVTESGIEVPMRPLDDLTPPGPIALLKVDVEGFELPVFRGAADTLSRTRTILFESWDQHVARYGYDVRDTLSLLEAAGFSLSRLGDDGEKRIDVEHLSPRCENLVARRSQSS